MGKVLTNEEREKRMAEDIWLNYFNRYLFEHGTISEKEYKVKRQILQLVKLCLYNLKAALCGAGDRKFHYIKALP